MNPPNPSPPPAPAPTPPPTSLTPDIVSNIPVKTPAGSGAASFNDEAELDKIMQDVGHELKKEDKKPRQKGRFGFKSKAKTEPNLAQPPTLNRFQTASAPAPVPKTEPQPTAKASAAPAATKPKPAKTNSAPVLVITFAVIITAALIAAAVYTYKK